MEALLKILSMFMIIILISVQLFLASPYRANLTDDSLNGRILELRESAIVRGNIVLDAIGDYTPNEVLVLLNGKPYKLVTVFPVGLDICEGDVVEVQLRKGETPFYVYLASQKGDIKTDLKNSTVLIEPGINHICAVRSKG